MSERPYLLILNAAEGLLQLLIARQDHEGPPTLLTAQSWHAPSQGAELLAPALNDALSRLRLSPRDFGRIAAVRGPGSFTGLRLALATISGLARATGALCAGLDYLPLLAMNALYAAPRRCEHAGPDQDRQKIPPPTVWVLTYARRNLVHLQGFCQEAVSGRNSDPENKNRVDAPEPSSTGLPFTTPPFTGMPHPVDDILVLSPEQAACEVARHSQKQQGGSAPLLLGSGLTRNHNAFCAALHSALAKAPSETRAAYPAAREGAAGIPLLLPSLFDHPLPQVLLQAAAHAVYTRQDVVPLYVRPADAVDNLENIARSLGLDPQAAKKRFADLTGRAQEPD